MDNERSQPTDEPNREFWRHLALELESRDALSVPVDVAAAPLSPEQEQLLWDFVEGRLDEAGEEKCLNLAMSNSAAARRLLEMQSALDAAESMPRTSAAAVWHSVSRGSEPAPSHVSPQVRQLIIELAEAGLNLIYSAGSPAFAPALGRSDDASPPTSIAHEFLTSVGKIQLVVDQTSQATCALTIIVSRPLHPERLGSVLLKLEGAERGTTDTATLHDQRARFEVLGAGAYQLSFFDADQLLDQLVFDLTLQAAEDTHN